MEEFKRAKEHYENIPVSRELGKTVNEAIRKGELKMSGKNKKNTWKVPAGLVAAAACVMVFGLNTSETFANTMSGVPVIGRICQILTIRSYESETQEENVNITINKPELTVEPTEEADKERVMTAEEIAARVNDEINAKIAAYTDEANQQIEEYKQAFLATGGTEEEWAARNIVVDVNYEVKSQTDEILSFAMNYSENWAAAYAQTDFYNISLVDGHDITLQELLGEDYEDVIEENVRTQIAEETAKDSNRMYWIGSADEKTMIEEDIFENPDFYINEAGNAVVVYEKYAIAPGYMGVCEFEIKK